MSESIGTVGDLFYSAEELRVEWKISQFSKLSEEVGELCRSPYFTFSDVRWYVKICQNGNRKYKNVDQVALYLVKKEGPKKSVTFSLGLKRSDGGRMCANKCMREFDENGSECIWQDYIQRYELFNRRPDLLPCDVLTVQCTLRVQYQLRPVGVSLFDRLLNLSCNLRKVHNEEKWTDVVLKLKGQEFKVHSAILKNRPNMLIDDLEESNSDIINIMDVQEDVFERLLSYIYCARGEGLTEENVYQMYSAAGKYCIWELKDLCTTYMEENMSDRLFCDALYVAENFQEKRLKESVMKYFRENSVRIMKTEEWKKFHAVNISLAFEFLASFIEENALNFNGESFRTSVETQTADDILFFMYIILGNISLLREELLVEWKITGFSTLSDRVDACYKSPDFPFLDARWYLKIYPNGESKSEPDGHIKLYVIKIDGSKMSVNYFLDFKSENSDETNAKGTTGVFEGNDSGWCWNKYFQRSQLTRLKGNFLPSDVLTVQCRLKVDWKSCPIKVSLLERLLNLSRDFKEILKSEDSTDIVLKVDGREFNAHRAILEQRSEVFAAMLRHDMEESRTGVINIEDVQADVFERLLSYTYCARGEDLTDQNVRHVYVAADKYDIGELRHLCTAYMTENMSDRLFSDALFVADTFQDTRLKEATMKYFRENSMSILETDEWKKLDDDNHEIVFQFLISFVKETAFNDNRN